MRAILDPAVRPEGRLRIGNALAKMGRKIGRATSRPRSGSKVNRRTLPSAMINSHDVTLKRRAETEPLLPATPKIVLAGGLDVNAHCIIRDRVDKIHANHPNMVLLRG